MIRLVKTMQTPRGLPSGHTIEYHPPADENLDHTAEVQAAFMALSRLHPDENPMMWSVR
jgi:hypothetical protein